MGILRLITAASLLSSAAFGFYCSSKQKNALNTDTAAACKKMRRALYVMEKFPDRIKQVIGESGPNISVYFKNPEFYKTRLRNRVRACDKGPIPLSCAGSWGRCWTSRETVAYVLVTFGYVHSTINVCNTYFSDPPDVRAATLAHEFGRLENIGDSPEFDTNSIYVWDRIVGGLSEDYNYEPLTAPR
jgi:hypothetical protein